MGAFASLRLLLAGPIPTIRKVRSSLRPSLATRFKRKRRTTKHSCATMEAFAQHWRFTRFPDFVSFATFCSKSSRFFRAFEPSRFRDPFSTTVAQRWRHLRNIGWKKADYEIQRPLNRSSTKGIKESGIKESGIKQVPPRIPGRF